MAGWARSESRSSLVELEIRRIVWNQERMMIYLWGSPGRRGAWRSRADRVAVVGAKMRRGEEVGAAGADDK
jgi:hypothetical protein